MAVLPTGAFDSKGHDDMMGSFDPIPGGSYLAHITGSSIHDTKARTGKYISLEFTIIDGKYKGRKIWTNLNIINPNPVAVEIAQKELATICRACGKPVIQDTQELHAIPFLLKLKIVAAKGDFPAKNEPCGYSLAGGAKSSPTTGGEKKKATVATGKVPWAKKGGAAAEPPADEEEEQPPVDEEGQD